ncbi:MFS transporter [cyanobiont of Ornithocercus magnificus]|nr:MFS transporter [cyanobiont of Ornithocercus magnificus]
MTARLLPLHTVLRLGLFQSSVGAMAYVFSGLLNRVMLSELALPGLLVGSVLAIEQIMALSRVLFGQVSDRFAILGCHRVPYIWVGTTLFSLLSLLSVPLIFRLSEVTSNTSKSATLAVIIITFAGLFALYGLGISMATTPFLALVIDRTNEEERPQVVGILWCMLSIGLIIGAISGELSLRGLDGVIDSAVLEASLFSYVQRVVAVVMLLTLIGTWGQEEAHLTHSRSEDREDSLSLTESWRLIQSSGQVFVFAVFLLLFTLSLFLQDPVLESYGAEIFGMSISQTSRLTANWGIGVLIGLSGAGFLIVPRIGKLATARFGCWLVISSMLLLITSGCLRNSALLLSSTFVFGLASGIGTNGVLCLMLDFTLSQAAGAFVGLWGLTQALSRALGKLLGGLLLSLGRLIEPDLGFSNSSLLPFLLVLVVEGLIAIAALLVSFQLSMKTFREDTSGMLSQVLELE